MKLIVAQKSNPVAYGFICVFMIAPLIAAYYAKNIKVEFVDSNQIEGHSLSFEFQK